MSDFLSQDAAVDAAMGILGEDAPVIENNIDTPAADTETVPNAPEKRADDTAAPAEPEPQAPAIEPPASWKAEAKARFKDLPPDIQQVIADRESERDRGLSEAQRKSADAQKALEAAQAAVEAERTANVEKLRQFVNVALINPKLQQWNNRDWAQYHRDNPLEAPAEWIEYQQFIAQVTRVNDEAKRLEQQSLAEKRQKAHDKLSESTDFWKDDAKRREFQTDFGKYLGDNQFSKDEIDLLADPRWIILGRKAMLYDKIEAEKANIAAKKVQASVTRSQTLRTQATEPADGNQRAANLRAKAQRSGKIDDLAAAVLATIQ